VNVLPAPSKMKVPFPCGVEILLNVIHYFPTQMRERKKEKERKNTTFITFLTNLPPIAMACFTVKLFVLYNLMILFLLCVLKALDNKIPPSRVSWWLSNCLLHGMVGIELCIQGLPWISCYFSNNRANTWIWVKYDHIPKSYVKKITFKFVMFQAFLITFRRGKKNNTMVKHNYVKSNNIILVRCTNKVLDQALSKQNIKFGLRIIQI